VTDRSEVRRAAEEARRRIEAARREIDDLRRESMREARRIREEWRRTFDEARHGWAEGGHRAFAQLEDPWRQWKQWQWQQRARRHHQHHRPMSPEEVEARRRAGEERRRRRRDAWRTDSALLGLLLVVAGVVWLIQASGAVDLPVEGVVAAALMVLGLAIVVTARTSRRLWPIFLGGVLVLVLLARGASVSLPVNLSGFAFGNRQVLITSNADIRPVNLTAGRVDVTLGCGVTTGTLPVNDSFGRLRLHVPDDLAFRLVAHVSGGAITQNGVKLNGGMGLDQTHDFGPPTPTPLIVTANVTFGSIDVLTDQPRCATGVAPSAPARTPR